MRTKTLLLNSGKFVLSFEALPNAAGPEEEKVARRTGKCGAQVGYHGIILRHGPAKSSHERRLDA